jgi:hypothetical protein
LSVGHWALSFSNPVAPLALESRFLKESFRLDSPLAARWRAAFPRDIAAVMRDCGVALGLRIKPDFMASRGMPVEFKSAQPAHAANLSFQRNDQLTIKRIQQRRASRYCSRFEKLTRHIFRNLNRFACTAALRDQSLHVVGGSQENTFELARNNLQYARDKLKASTK